MIRRILTTLVLVLTTSVAAREVVIPATPRSFNTTYLGANNGQIVGFQIFDYVTLTNPSAVAQTGTIELLPGTELSAGQAGRSGVVSGHLLICGSSGSSGRNYSFSTTTGYSGPLLTPANWSLPAGASTKMLVGTVVQFTFANSGPSNFNDLVMYYAPIIRIRVNESHGYLVGSLLPYVDGWNSGMSTCTGFNSSVTGPAVLLPPNYRTLPSLPILAGKAF